jgi:hypothetical protein
MLTSDKLREILNYSPETGTFTWKTGSRAGWSDQGYNRLDIEGRKYKCSRLAWLWMTGSWPTKHIDHINLDKADDRWMNLRECNRSQNLGNIRRFKTNKSGAKGVWRDPKRLNWKVQIRVEGTLHYIGRFLSKAEAIAAYREAAIRHRGEFARFD